MQHVEFDSASIGIQRAKVEQLIGGDARHNAEIATKLFEGQEFENSQAIKDMVALNAAAGITAYEMTKQNSISTAELESQLSAGFKRAQDAIDSGAAYAKLTSWSAATQRF